MNVEGYMARAPTFAVYDGFCKTKSVMDQHSRILVSVSGGSDSDDMVDVVEHLKPGSGCEVDYVWFNTGIEMDATKAHMVLAMCVGGFLGFGLGMMLFALVMRPADEAGRKSDAERIRRLEGELQATSAKYREMANMMAYWRSRCIAYEKMLVERSRKAGAEK